MRLNKGPGPERSEELGRVKEWGGWRWKFSHNGDLGKGKKERVGGRGRVEEPGKTEGKGVRGLSR